MEERKDILYVSDESLHFTKFVITYYVVTIFIRTYFKDAVSVGCHEYVIEL
jgi:hypothetical protein